MNEQARSKEKREMEDLRSVVENATSGLAKARMLLGNWIEEYGFNKKPDPVAAIANIQGTERSEEGFQSCKWYFDYDTIFKTVDISYDYVLQTLEDLEKAIRKEGGLE